MEKSAAFTTTHWSAVLHAGGGDSPTARAALERLCAACWYPLYAHARRRGHGPDDAADLTQEFFAVLLRRNSLAPVGPEKGRFRTFLLTSLDYFLHDQSARAHAAKRGLQFHHSLLAQSCAVITNAWWRGARRRCICPAASIESAPPASRAPAHRPERAPRRHRHHLLRPAGRRVCANTSKIQVRIWALERSGQYGSKHHDEKPLTLTLPDIEPVWQMDIRYELKSAKGEPVKGVIQNSIHALGQ